MKKIFALIRRNVKMFFKDKALFFTSLITPMILLVLYATFLANVYEDSFTSVFSEFNLSDELVGGIVGGQLVSSLLAVSCITVAFCSNMLMVQDKVSGAFGDFCITPTKRSNFAIAYFLASLFSTLIITIFASAVGFIYLAFVGWYLSFTDVVLILLDVFILTVFGTALSSIINSFLSSQGQISAVGSIVSSCYGFLCGAYMPISSFAEGLRNVLYCTPGTYGTALLRNHALRGATESLAKLGIPKEATEAFKEMTDMKINAFGTTVPEGVMYAILGSAAIITALVYVLIYTLRARKKRSH